LNAVLAQHLVLPLNNPPHFPRYNGGMEKSIGDLKRGLSQRLAAPAEERLLLVAVEATTHELNHRRRRCLEGKTACAVYHATAWRGVVEAWLRRQALITVGHQPKPNQNVSTIFPKKWSHN